MFVLIEYFIDVIEFSFMDFIDGEVIEFTCFYENIDEKVYFITVPIRFLMFLLGFLFFQLLVDSDNFDESGESVEFDIEILLVTIGIDICVETSDDPEHEVIEVSVSDGLFEEILYWNNNG